MKIFSSEQIRQLDAWTIKHEPISSIDLMERASIAFVNWFTSRFGLEKKVIVFCGPGNNGGDGLAVSRLLLERKYNVETYVVSSSSYSDEFKINEQRLLQFTPLLYIKSSNEIPNIPNDVIVIDALFGSGLSRPAEGIYAEVIATINNSDNTIVSVDIASGLFCDRSNEKNDVIVKSTFTVSFQLPKLAFLLPQNEEFVGKWYAKDIGLSSEFIDQTETNYYYLTEKEIKPLISKRKVFSHKGNYGKTLLIGGSYGMVGAMVLATRACLRTGVGLSVTYIPSCGYDILQTAVPENMIIADKEEKFISDIPELNSFSAIGVGPGLGKRPETINAFIKLLDLSEKPLVIDADALNILSENKELLERLPAGSILTPHPKEFERLAGTTKNDFERLEIVKEFSKKYNVIVALKGAHTAIVSPEGRVYFNSTGNPGMATGGSGDVLTGIITSLLGQGYSNLIAAILGVYMHGYAGNVAAKEKSEPAMLPSDIIDKIPDFYKKFS